MPKISRPSAPSEQLRGFAVEVSEQLAPLANDVEARKADAARRLEASELSQTWRRAVERGVGRDEALYGLLKETDGWRHGNLVRATSALQQVANVVHSFEALCETLDRAQGLPAEEQVDRAKARAQFGERAKILSRLETVREAIDAAGTCAAVGRFPKAQLDRLEHQLRADLDALTQARDGVRRVPTPQLRAADVATPAAAAKQLARLLGDDALEGKLLDATKGVQGKAADALAKDLEAIARLADEVVHAPDYATLGKGWFHPRARSEYRARLHDGWTNYGSEPRQDASARALKAALEGALGSAKPAEALRAVLVERFLTELAVPEHRRADWAPKAEAIAAALRDEAFLPLRALNETIASMTKGDAGLEPHVRAAVENVTRHLVEGDYREWRYDNPRSKHQLGGLSAAQKATWTSSAKTESRLYDGTQLTAREADGADLLWLTKIGGPSHGFDYGGECLLPLLSNGRTKAIVVDDPRWEHNAAARAYLRLLHFDDGTPTLYLEPLQRDFPHRDRFADGREDDGFQRAILAHAIAKADELGLTLSVPPWLEATMRDLGHGFEHHHDHHYVLRASNGVYEASDTLSNKHDWPQMRDERTDGLERLLYVPKR